MRLDGNNYVVLRAAIDMAPLHLAAISGTLTLPQLKSYYGRKDGFVVRLQDVGTKLTFAWAEVVSFADDVMFFGPLVRCRETAPSFLLMCGRAPTRSKCTLTSAARLPATHLPHTLCPARTSPV